MSAALRIYEMLLRFKRLAYDVLPLFSLIPLSILVMSYYMFPTPPKEAPSFLSPTIIIDAILLSVSFFISLLIPRYDRWVMRPIISSSIRFNEIAGRWLIEPVMAIGVSLLGLLPCFLIGYWSSVVPYIFISYISLLVVALRLKFHFEIIDQRLSRLGGQSGVRGKKTHS